MYIFANIANIAYYRQFISLKSFIWYCMLRVPTLNAPNFSEALNVGTCSMHYQIKLFKLMNWR